jgi:hypothetical protein
MMHNWFDESFDLPNKICPLVTSRTIRLLDTKPEYYPQIKYYKDYIWNCLILSKQHIIEHGLVLLFGQFIIIP